MRTIHDWPYPEMDNLYNAGDHSWIEVDEEIFYDQLECVPPARMRANAFMVGECWDEREEGALHSAFVEVQGRFFGRVVPLRKFNPARFTTEVIQQFHLSPPCG